MTLLSLRTRTAQLLAYEGFSTLGEDASGSVLDDAINFAQDQLSRRLYLYSGHVTFTTSASFQYDVQDTSVFSKRMLEVDRVVIGGSILRDARGQYGLYSLPELDAWYPTWRTGATGTVVAAAFLNPVLVLTPAPTGSLSNCFVQGRHLANALTATGDVSDLPVEVHDFICYLAAVYLQQPNVDTQDGFSRLATYQANALDLLAELFITQYRAVHGRMPLSVPGMKGAA